LTCITMPWSRIVAPLKGAPVRSSTTRPVTGYSAFAVSFVLAGTGFWSLDSCASSGKAETATAKIKRPNQAQIISSTRTRVERTNYRLLRIGVLHLIRLTWLDNKKCEVESG